MRRTKLNKVSKTSTAQLQKKCDALLTPIIKKFNPRCEACGASTQVAHHWIEKSRSSNLRYRIDNLIPLCNPCHTKIHNRFGNSVVGGLDVAQTIIDKRGDDWYEQMKIDGRVQVKTDSIWYQGHLERLTNLLNEN
jgi:hypothetical protein